MHSAGWNVIARDTLHCLASEGTGEFTPASVVSKQTLPCLYPDLPLEAAPRYVNQVPVVPVVNRADSRNLEGVISSEAVLRNIGDSCSEAGHLSSRKKKPRSLRSGSGYRLQF
jgi:chloride channel protein, CIC family